MKCSEYETWFESFTEKDDIVFEQIETLMPLYFEFMEKHEHKASLSVLGSFIVRLGSLKNALVVLANDDNIYATKALYRIFIEHWLKASYVFMRYITERNSNVGIDYNSLLHTEEIFTYVKSARESLNTGEKDDAVCKEFDNTFKTLLEASDHERYKKIKKSFTYKNIIKYLIENKAPGSKWLSNITSEYSELSSYVHGGPDSVRSRDIFKEDNRYESYRGMLRFAFNMHLIFIFSIFNYMQTWDNPQKKRVMIASLIKLYDVDGKLNFME